jgi:hypothetical protein
VSRLIVEDGDSLIPDLDSALAVARELLWPAFERVGFHIALTGSILYRGTSSKDIDFLLFPRDKRNADWGKAEKVVAGFDPNFQLKATAKYRNRDTWVCTIQSCRIDFLLVDKPGALWGADYAVGAAEMPPHAHAIPIGINPPEPPIDVRAEVDRLAREHAQAHAAEFGRAYGRMPARGPLEGILGYAAGNAINAMAERDVRRAAEQLAARHAAQAPNPYINAYLAPQGQAQAPDDNNIWYAQGNVLDGLGRDAVRPWRP